MEVFRIPDRAERARQLRHQGISVIGYFCCYTPVELITAAGLVPYRITGAAGKPAPSRGPVLETVVCPFVRRVFEMGTNGEYDFISGLVMGNTCDTVGFCFTAFTTYWRPAFAHFLDIPHKATESAQQYYRSEFERLRHALGVYAGLAISDEALRQAIFLHNRNRELQRELYDLRKKEPPSVSASEVLDIIVCNLGMPVETGNGLLEAALGWTRAGKAQQTAHRTRLLLWGSQLDSTRILDIIEGCGADVVADDLCLGYRGLRLGIEVTPDPMVGLTKYYSESQVCGRSYRDTVEERFGHIKSLVAESRVEGAILYLLRYCDINGFDMPSLKAYLKDMGVPAIVIEDDYSGSSLAQVKTRVQAFVEMLEQR